MYSNLEEKFCLKCFLKPCLSTALVYGLDPFVSCNCEDAIQTFTLRKKQKKFYCRLVEFLLWEHVVLMLWQTIPIINQVGPCISGFTAIKSGVVVYKMAITFFAVSLASSFSFLKNNKMHPKFVSSNVNCFHLKEIHEAKAVVNSISLQLSLVMVLTSFSFQILNVFAMYPPLEAGQNFEGEALFCCIEVGLWINLLIGIIGHYLLLGGLFIFLTKKAFQQVSDELSLLRIRDLNIKSKLHLIMWHHQEVWSFVEQLNNKVSYPFVVIYAFVTSATSFSYYMYLYIDQEEAVRYAVLGVAVIFTFICIMYGFLLCSYAFVMQNTYQDIRRFAKCELEFEFELNILNFMKRFGKVPLTLSMGGFFYITKKFPTKMASTLHSLFSGLLKMRDVSHPSKNCDLIPVANITDIYRNN